MLNNLASSHGRATICRPMGSPAWLLPCRNCDRRIVDDVERVGVSREGGHGGEFLPLQLYLSILADLCGRHNRRWHEQGVEASHSFFVRNSITSRSSS